MAKDENKAYYELTQAAVWPWLKDHLEKLMRRDVKYAMTQEDVMANNRCIAQAEAAKSILTLITDKAASHLRVQKPSINMPPPTIITE